MSEKSRTRWVIAGIVGGWAVTGLSLLWSVAGKDALAMRQIETNAEAINQYEHRINDVESRSDKLNRDIEWIKEALVRIERRQNGR